MRSIEFPNNNEGKNPVTFMQPLRPWAEEAQYQICDPKICLLRRTRSRSLQNDVEGGTFSTLGSRMEG